VRDRGLRPRPDARGRRLRGLGLVPAMTVRSMLAVVRACPPGRGSPTGTRTSCRTTTVRVGPIGYGDGIPRRGSSRHPSSRPGRSTDRRPGLHGPDRGRPRWRRRRAGDPVVLFGPGRTGSPPHRTGRTPAAPSATRSSPHRRTHAAQVRRSDGGATG
jgi:alanine racemase